MFKMKNKLGNAILNAKTERRRDALIRCGFTPVEDDAEPTFSKMKKDELIAYAEGHNIDISSANTKDEIIAILRAE